MWDTLATWLQRTIRVEELGADNPGLRMTADLIKKSLQSTFGDLGICIQAHYKLRLGFSESLVSGRGYTPILAVQNKFNLGKLMPKHGHGPVLRSVINNRNDK